MAKSWWIEHILKCGSHRSVFIIQDAQMLVTDLSTIFGMLCLWRTQVPVTSVISGYFSRLINQSPTLPRHLSDLQTSASRRIWSAQSLSTWLWNAPCSCIPAPAAPAPSLVLWQCSKVQIGFGWNWKRRAEKLESANSNMLRRSLNMLK